MMATKKSLLVIAALVILGLSFLVSKTFNKNPNAIWHMINVNAQKKQGDAHLIIIGDTQLLIDAGYKSEAYTNLLPYLQNLGIKRIHHLFISHPHKDHYEGVAAIWDALTIENLYIKLPPKEICDREIPWGCHYSHVQKFIQDSIDKGITVHQPKTGFALTLPSNSTIEILHAQEYDPPGLTIDVNDLSIIMKWKINENEVLFTGDLNYQVGAMLATDSRMKSDFLKMPHHGLASLAPNAFFNTVNPDFVMVPAPKHLWCSERAQQAKNWANNNAESYWVNGLHGNVRVEFYNDGGAIYSEHNNTCSIKDASDDSALPLEPHLF